MFPGKLADSQRVIWRSTGPTKGFKTCVSNWRAAFKKISTGSMKMKDQWNGLRALHLQSKMSQDKAQLSLNSSRLLLCMDWLWFHVLQPRVPWSWLPVSVVIWLQSTAISESEGWRWLRNHPPVFLFTILFLAISFVPVILCSGVFISLLLISVGSLLTAYLFTLSTIIGSIAAFCLWLTVVCCSAVWIYEWIVDGLWVRLTTPAPTSQNHSRLADITDLSPCKTEKINAVELIENDQSVLEQVQRSRSKMRVQKIPTPPRSPSPQLPGPLSKSQWHYQ